MVDRQDIVREAILGFPWHNYRMRDIEQTLDDEDASARQWADDLAGMIIDMLDGGTP